MAADLSAFCNAYTQSALFIHMNLVNRTLYVVIVLLHTCISWIHVCTFMQLIDRLLVVENKRYVDSVTRGRHQCSRVTNVSN